MLSIRGVLVVLAAGVSGCGPASTTAPEPAAAEAPQQKSPFSGEHRRWLALYEQAGLPAISQASRLEVRVLPKGTFLPAWRLPDQGGRLLWDTLEVARIDTGCETVRQAAQLLRTSAPPGWQSQPCVPSPTHTVQIDFLQELEARLEADAECSGELAPPRTMRLDAVSGRLVFSGDAKKGPSSGGLRWVAYAHWAHELGRDDLAQSALVIAEEQLAVECPSEHCVAIDQLRAAAQRVLLHSVVSGLSDRWLDWRDALDLASRARAIAPKANQPVAEQIRRLAGQLELDLARDRWRRDSAVKRADKLSADQQVDAFLDVLPDETGAGLEQVHLACAPASPAARLIERAPVSIPPLIARLEDNRLTRTRAPDAHSGLPLLRVGEVALMALERIAGKSLRPAATDLPQHCRGPAAEDCWALEARLAKAAATDWWNSAEQLPAVDLASRAARRLRGAARSRALATLRALDQKRFAEVVGLAADQAPSPPERAASLRLLRPEQLAPIQVPADCDATATKGWLSPRSGQRNRAAREWQRAEHRVGRRLQLSQHPSVAVNEVLAGALRNQSPEIRLAAAQVLLAWGRADAAFAIARDARPRKRARLSGPRLLRSIEYLLASRRQAAADVASELVDPDNLDTLAAARRGLTEAVLTAKAKEQKFALSARARQRLTHRAASALGAAWAKLEQPGPLGRVETDWYDAWRILSLLQRGPDAAPSPNATLFDRMLDAQARLDAATQGTDTKISKPDWLVLPSAGSGETAWATVRAVHLRGRDSPSGAASAWLVSLKDQALDPQAALLTLAELAQANPGIEWELHAVRHAQGRGVTLLVSGRESQVAGPQFFGRCDGPDPCSSLHEPRVPRRAVERRVGWFSRQVAQRWPEHREHTLEVVFTAAYPTQPNADNCP